MGAGVFSAGGHTDVWLYQHLGCGGRLHPQGFPHKSREVKEPCGGTAGTSPRW